MAAAGVDSQPKPLTRKSARFSLRKMFSKSQKSLASEEGESSSEPSKKDEQTLMCNVCFAERPISMFPPLITCEHRTCTECLKQYLTIAIREWRVMVSCPECSEVFHPSDIKNILNDAHLFGKYEEFTLRRALVSIPDIRWCPAPDCGYAVIAAGCASCPQLKCQRPGCKTEFCYHCRQIWHPNTTCDTARLRNSLEIRSLSSSERRGSSSEDMKSCPRCGALIIKMDDGSCNHMTCCVCGAEFCWLCMKEISDLHYLSPSGCTFWGKKPWSRKKKILWQMGTLIGAPVGIGLAAGVVLPAMMIGIPIYVGRRIKDRFDFSNSIHKRNLAITGGVALSIALSPFLAALTVGVGVPIALGYVYGVVPISLCRSGGCTGLTTSRNGPGVNLDFDERDDVYSGPANYSGKNSPARRNSHASSMLDNTSFSHGSNVLAVKATVNKEQQPSITGLSQDSTSLDSRSLISHYRVDGDVDSHASLIPQPRSTTVSITSSLENVHSSNGAVNMCASLPEVSCEGDEPIIKDDLVSNTSQLSTGSQFSAAGQILTNAQMPSETEKPTPAPAHGSTGTVSFSLQDGILIEP